ETRSAAESSSPVAIARMSVLGVWELAVGGTYSEYKTCAPQDQCAPPHSARSPRWIVWAHGKWLLRRTFREWLLADTRHHAFDRNSPPTLVNEPWNPSGRRAAAHDRGLQIRTRPSARF